MVESFDNQRHKKYNHKDLNYYDSFESNYYKLDAFYQPNDHQEVFHVQNFPEPECQFCRSRFASNNILHNHLQKGCKGHLNLQKKDSAILAFTTAINSTTISQSQEKEVLQFAAFKIYLLSIYLSIYPQIKE